MECNEDGFTAEDLTSICSVGRSSKERKRGFIGEKGIGFKSVFKTMSRVEILSGNFSFYFQHKQGDPAIYMITPIWKDHEGDSVDHLTRITLLIRDDGGPDAINHRREDILKQFKAMHENILLFLNNLTQIDVTYFDNLDEKKSMTTFTIERQSEFRIAVKTWTDEGGDGEEKTTYYHTTKHNATNLAPSQKRKYTDQDLKSHIYSNSEVVLAFPLDNNSVPILANQWIFAFLPIREMGFKVFVEQIHKILYVFNK